MPLYTVLAPPQGAGDTAPDPLRFVFVKEGFAWPALFVPELWLLFRRLWVVFLVYIAVSLALLVIAGKYGSPLPLIALALMHLLFALEANELRRGTLRRRGYAFVGVVEGRRREAELRFFSEWEPPVATAAPPAEPPPAVTEATEVAPWKPEPPARPSAEAGEVVGLFPSPGGGS